MQYGAVSQKSPPVRTAAFIGPPARKVQQVSGWSGLGSPAPKPVTAAQQTAGDSQSPVAPLLAPVETFSVLPGEEVSGAVPLIGNSANQVATAPMGHQPLAAPVIPVSEQRQFLPSPADRPHTGGDVPQNFAPGLSTGEAASAIPTVPQIPLNTGSAELLQVSPDFGADQSVVWWEQDIPQTMLRGRQPFVLTLNQALGLALNEAPELQVLHSEWYIQQTEVDRLNAAFDWTTFVDAVWNRDSAPVGSTLDGATNRLRSRTLNSSAGVRRFYNDGSEFEISQSLGLQNSNSQFLTPNNQGNSRLALEYQRPFMRGAGVYYNTSPQRLAAIAKDTAFDRFQAGIQDHLLQVATSYWQLVLQRGRFLQSVQSWTRAKAIADEMATRTEIDVTPNMLDRARSEVAMRLSSSIEAEHDIVRAQDAVLRLIYGARFTDYADQELITDSLPTKDTATLQAGPHIERAIKNRSEVHQAIREIKAASIRYQVAANEVMPMLNMVLTGYVAGLRGNNNVASSVGDQFRAGEPGVGIGFNFEIPYRNRAAQANAEQAHIATKRIRAQLQATLGVVTEDVRNQVIQRNKHAAVLSNKWEALARAKRILKYTETRREVLADGTAVADLYLENLLLMQSRLERAESSYLESQVRYTLADNALLRSVSELETLADRSATGNCQSCLTDSADARTENAAGNSGHSFGQNKRKAEVRSADSSNGFRPESASVTPASFQQR